MKDIDTFIQDLIPKITDKTGNVNRSKVTTKQYQAIQDRLQYPVVGLVEQLYSIEYNIIKHPLCPVCLTKKLKFCNAKYQYYKTCSKKCANKLIISSGVSKHRVKNRSVVDMNHITTIPELLDVVYDSSGAINSNYMLDYASTFNTKLIKSVFTQTSFCTTESFSERIHIISLGLKSSDMVCNSCGNHILLGKTYCSVGCSNSSPIKKEQTHKTCLSRYGYPTNLMTTSAKELRLKNGPPRTRDHWPDEFVDISSLRIFATGKTKHQISEHFGVHYSCVCKMLRQHNIEHDDSCKRRSNYEDELISYISNMRNLTIVSNDRSIISPYELDIYLPDINKAIEFDGDYYHSVGSVIDEDNRRHLIFNKSKLLTSTTLSTLFINEHMWNVDKTQRIYKSMIATILGMNTTIGARECEVIECNSPSIKQNFQQFLDDNHLQGKQGFTIGYGLKYQDELICVLTFSKPRFSQKYEWEIIRLCSKSGTSVVGGGSRLLAHFEKKYTPKSIVTFADNRWSSSWNNVYLKMGFKLDNTYKQLGYVWWKGTSVLTRYQTTKKTLVKLLSDFNPMQTERENMYNHGYRKLFDRGQSKYIKIINN